MPINTIISKNQVNKFSDYPEAMDQYFDVQNVVIKIMPIEFIPGIEKKKSDIKIKSASQYINYLSEEILFWNQYDPKQKLKSFSKIDTLEKAKHFFDNAHSYFLDQPQMSNGVNSLKQSIQAIDSGTVCSKTTLASFLIKHIDESGSFFVGFRYGLLQEKGTTFSATTGILEGFNAALSFRKYIREYCIPLKTELANFEQSLVEATQNYSELNQKYTKSFHEHEKCIQSIVVQTNTHFQDLENQTESYFSERDKRCSALENLYEEKLRLQGPAKYWADLEKFYRKRGVGWLITSIATTILVICSLITTLALIPNLFSEDSHWLDVFKNSAIITVITSIAIYMLRLFVKMTMSSFHLSRDAKERNNLTYFYLALIENKAVSEKERALILNSLFSRADTGLLKGDSSPTMSGNVTELVESLNGTSH